MNVINGHRQGIVTPALNYNTFLGGVASVFVDEATLAAEFSGATAGDIQNFEIIGSDIRCLVEVNYTLASSAFYGIGADLTYFLDIDGYCTGTAGSVFRNTVHCTDIVVPNLTSSSSHAFRNSNSRYCRYEQPYITGAAGYNQNSGIKRFYSIQAASVWGGSNVASNNLFLNTPQSYVIYAHPSMATINGGGVEPDILNATTVQGASVVYVTDTTPPVAVNDLSVSSITATTVNLDFTTPVGSTNALDWYEVWIDDGTENPILMHTIFDEITATGDTLTGLTSGTTYDVKIYACDIFWNRSLVSNTVSFTTL